MDINITIEVWQKGKWFIANALNWISFPKGKLAKKPRKIF